MIKIEHFKNNDIGVLASLGYLKRLVIAFDSCSIIFYKVYRHDELLSEYYSFGNAIDAYNNIKE